MESEALDSLSKVTEIQFCSVMKLYCDYFHSTELKQCDW
jgi:hypothetical protein